MEKKRELTKSFWITWLIIIFILILVVAIGFGLFVNRKEEVIVNEENGGNVVLNYSSNVAGLKIVNATPITDAVGIKKSDEGDYFDFSVESKLDNAASLEYELSLTKNKKTSTISDDDIRIYLEKEESGTYTAVFEPKAFEALKKDNEYGTKTGDMVLVHTKKTKATVDHYRLRMWLRDQSLVPNGTYEVEINVTGISK